MVFFVAVVVAFFVCLFVFCLFVVVVVVFVDKFVSGLIV